MNIARVNGDSVVVNIEVADEEWLEAARTTSVEALIPYDDDNPAGIGWTYDDATGTFAAPPRVDNSLPTEGTPDE